VSNAVELLAIECVIFLAYLRNTDTVATVYDHLTVLLDDT
jgi:hypothetical protein